MELGNNVTIYPNSKIVNSDRMKIGDNSRIDDFTFINCGNGITIGRYVHISVGVTIIGGGELWVGDYASIATGSRILTGTDSYYGGKRMSSALPEEERYVIRGKVVIEKDAFIGANAVIHPNVTIGEGAIIACNSVAMRDVEPWSINLGNPCKKIGMRPKIE